MRQNAQLQHEARFAHSSFARDDSSFKVSTIQQGIDQFYLRIKWFINFFFQMKGIQAVVGEDSLREKVLVFGSSNFFGKVLI